MEFDELRVLTLKDYDGVSEPQGSVKFLTAMLAKSSGMPKSTLMDTSIYAMQSGLVDVKDQLEYGGGEYTINEDDGTITFTLAHPIGIIKEIVVRQPSPNDIPDRTVAYQGIHRLLAKIITSGGLTRKMLDSMSLGDAFGLMEAVREANSKLFPSLG